MISTDIVVIGGGPAGLAAAITASENKKKVILIERSDELGGILPQCIHYGFGNFKFKQMLTGPEYNQLYLDMIRKTDVKIMLDTMVLEIGKDKTVIATNKKEGIIKIKSDAIVLAMGCRERTRSQILLPGTRPAGVYTAGTTQRMINVEGVFPGKKIVILGSGDVGLIMARRFTLEGAMVCGVFEIMQHPGGLTRNIVQCLDDYDIPLHLSHTVTMIHGNRRVSGVTVAKVDPDSKKVKEGTERYIECDTLILAVGLIPENELSKTINIELDETTGGPIVDQSMQTNITGIFACGNVVHVHDIVDDVSESAEIAGKNAAEYVNKKSKSEKIINVKQGKNVSYVIPQLLRGEITDDVIFYFRVKKVMKEVKITVNTDEKIVKTKNQKIVKPPEMIKIKIPKSEIRALKAKEMIINVGGRE